LKGHLPLEKKTSESFFICDIIRERERERERNVEPM